MKKEPMGPCPVCGEEVVLDQLQEGGACPLCSTLITTISQRPELVQQLWATQYASTPLPPPVKTRINSEAELPDVLDAKRYRTVDRDNNKWYLSVSEVNGKPVEVFASTAFDRDHELQSRISNLTTITRLISLLLRHLSLGEPLTYEKCLKQIQRSSRQRNDLPDMLYGVLRRYASQPLAGKQAEEKPGQERAA